MRYLLDTHAWIWAALGDTRLGSKARRALSNLSRGERVGLAAISLKEAAWLLARGRIELLAPSASWPRWLRETASAPGLEVLPLTVEVAIESERLPQSLPRDPADRLIAATARIHDVTLLTADAGLHGHEGLATLG